MDTELKHPNLKSDSTSLDEASTTLPIYGESAGKISHLFSIPNISKITVQGLQLLATHFAPETLGKALKELDALEAQKASEVFKHLTVEPSPDFVTALGWVSHMSTEDGSEWLKQEGLKSSSNESCGLFAARACVDHRNFFLAAVLKYMETAPFAERSFSVFRPNRPIQSLRPNVPDASMEIKANLIHAEYFQKRDYGPAVTTRHFLKGPRIGFVVDHATQRIGRAGYDLTEKTVTTLNRDHRSEQCAYDGQTNTVWVTARSPKDVVHHAKAIGELLFGDPDLFTKKIMFDVGFAIADTLAEKLASSVSGRIKSVSLIERVIKKNGAKSKIVDKAESTRDCLSLSTERYKGFHDTGTVVSIVLRVELLGERYTFQDVSIRAGTISSGLLLTESELQELLLKLGVMKAHSNA